jgi:2-oxoisovalerate dehydrogenase E1 component alpha subunit
MRPEDVLAPAYREYAAQFWRGVKPRDVLMYWGGDERGNDFEVPRNDFAWSVPIATQCLHAAGSALAFRIRGEQRVAVSVCGDGGSSKADFYAALNCGGAFELPLVLVVVNNQWAISVPRSKQTGAKTLAQKGIAGGLYCIQVDGNDVIDHTTADDARRYRDDAEVKAAWEKEPLGRLRAYLTRLGAWSDAKEEAWKEQSEARVNEEVDAYLQCKAQPVEAMFDFLYGEMPLEIAQQRALAVSREVSRG